MSTLKNTFIIVNLASKVKLKPIQMNTEWKNNIKYNLEKRVKGRCTNDGMITRIVQITEYGDNIISREDFGADSVFNIRYDAEVCVPLIGNQTVLKVANIIFDSNDFLLKCTNGHLTCVLYANEHKNILKIVKDELFVNGSTNPLKINDYVKVLITKKRIIATDTSIGIFGTLIDVATEQEVKEFYNSSYKMVEVEQEQETNIQYNEDIDEDNLYADV